MTVPGHGQEHSLPDGRRPPSTGESVMALTSPALGFWLPLLGPWLSMLAVILVVPRAGRRIWPLAERWTRRSCVLAIAGLWLPGLLGLMGVFYGLGAVEAAGASGWLFLPLCAPDDVLTLAALATAVLALGAVLTVWMQRPWPWLIGAFAAPLAYGAAVHVQATSFSC